MGAHPRLGTDVFRLQVLSSFSLRPINTYLTVVAARVSIAAADLWTTCVGKLPVFQHI